MTSFEYDDFLRGTSKKRRRKLVHLHSDDEDSSDAIAERPVRKEGHSSEGESKESPIGD